MVKMPNPAFTYTRWPWPLNPFNARIMAAMYFGKDWAEIKMGVQTLVVYTAALFVVWLVMLSQYDPARQNGLTFGIAAGLRGVSAGASQWSGIRGPMTGRIALQVRLSDAS